MLTRVSNSSRRPSALLTVFLATLIVALLILLDRMSRFSAPGATSTAGVVTYVYDGDTLQVDGDGSVRLIGIDALDARDEQRTARQAAQLGLDEGQVVRWALRAEQRARELLTGRQVRLEWGAERKDAYGRTLAYLYYGHNGEEVLFNRLLLTEGLAVAYRGFEHRYRKQFLSVERKARAKRIGLWQEARGVP